MKTALLLTNSAETQQLLSEVLGERTNFVLLPPPPEASREKFDALFATWLRLVDAVIVDAASLGQATRWATESLSEARLQNHQAVVVRATEEQRRLHPFERSWLIFSDTDSADQVRQLLGAFFELRDTQAALRRADAVIGSRRAALPAFSPAPYPFDSYRYRDALKNLSRLLGRRLDERSLLAEFLQLTRELLGVGKLAIFEMRGAQLAAISSIGLAPHVVEHLRLTVDAGIGGCLAREARILRRSQAIDPLAVGYDPRIEREFELLGAEVAVPMFDNDQLRGVLVLSGKVTGEPLTNEELELVYHLLTQLAQAIRNLHLVDHITAQQHLVDEVLANVQSGVLVVDQDNRILSLNRCARKLLELSDEDLAGQDIRRLPGCVGDVVYEVLQTGAPAQDREVALPRTNRPLSVRASRFKQADSGKFVAVALIEDLTQIKMQQTRERELADKEFFTRLSFRLSHELKNSLVSIKIFAQLLPERYNDKEFREQFSSVVANEVNRVDVLINNLTFFSHPLGLVSEEIVLGDLIDGCVKNVSQEFGRKQLAQIINVGEKAPEATAGGPVVTVKKNLGHKLTRLEGDTLRLTQAFENVLRNAVQAMPSGGRLTISTSDAQPADFPDGQVPDGGAVRIEWLDTGEGISLENLKRATEPFVTTRNVGVGLGLTIVKKIVERHGGQLAIDSLLGRGATVVMVLPVKAQPHPDDALLQHLAKHGGAEEAAERPDVPNRLPKSVEQKKG